MNAIVTLPRDSKELVIVSKNNPDSAAIMLVSETTGMNDQGFLQVEKRVGLVKGTTEQIRKIAAGLKPGDNYSEKVMPVKLVIKESNEPFYAGQQPKINPTTAEVVTSGGSPVYRQTIVVGIDSPEQDVRLVTDKTPVATESAIKANKSFETKRS